MNSSQWSPWHPLALGAPIDAAVLAETLDGGQAFRWNRETESGNAAPDNTSSASTSPGHSLWLGTFGEHLVRLSLDPSHGIVTWSAPAACAATAGPALARYFDLTRDLRELTDALPWRSDAHLARCLAAFPGLRILRQPFGETLLGFLCSATKQIVQIKQMLALLAARHGAPLLAPETPNAELGTRNPERGTAAFPAPRRLPSWPELAAIPETDLRACLLGFRARYIHDTARFLAAHPRWLEETELLPYSAAKERLCSLPGVGEKVADCVLLFGAGRLEAFPVDIWIIKTMEKRYGLHGWKPAQIAHFGRTHFGPLAGLAQQYLFAWERKFGR